MVNRISAPGTPVVYLLEKLTNHGVFPPTPPVSRTQPSFFQVTSSAIHARLASEDAVAYSCFWASLFTKLPSSLTLQSILTSLLASIPPLQHGTDDVPSQRALVRQKARLLNGIVGSITPKKEELWESACAIITRRKWDIGMARVVVCWLSGGAGNEKVDDQGMFARPGHPLRSHSFCTQFSKHLSPLYWRSGRPQITLSTPFCLIISVC